MKLKVTYLIVLAAISALVSCKKADDQVQVTLTTSLNVINATADTLNFYVNGSRVNTSSSLYPLGSSGYIAVGYGKQNYEFKRPRSPVVLLSLPLTLDTSKVYSLYVAGNAAGQAFSTVDTLIADTSGRAKVRFINASPDAGDLTVLIGDTVNFKTRAFKTATGFLPLNAGNKRIRIYQAGSAIATIDEMRPLLAGKIYTLFTKGTLTGTGGAALGTGLVVNR